MNATTTRRPTAPTHYAVLGVTRTASAEQVQAAYRAAARRHHPDTGGDPDRMRAINAAWRVLRDPARRAAYNRQLARQAAPPDTGWAPDKLADSPATGQTTAHGTWSALLPPATLATSVLLLVTAGYSASPPLLVLAGSMFAVAIGLFVLAPLHAMTAAKGDDGRRTPW